MIKQIFGKLPRKPSSKSYPGDLPADGIIGVAARSNPGGKGTFGTDAVPAGDGNSSAGLEAATYDTLPSFRDVSGSEKPGLFLRKIAMCCVVFDFSDSAKNAREKELKRQVLLELVDYISTVTSKLNEAAIQEASRMVAANIFRSFPSSTGGEGQRAVGGFDAEEEEPTMDPAWLHLEIVYDFFLRFIASSETDAKIAKRYVDHSFILRLLDLFDSEDRRERDYLKTILHRVYGKFMIHRPFTRKAINNIFYRFIFETEKHNGIAELLEVLGSIINGFALPLKEEHKLFLVRALIPLHKPKCLAMYHHQLSYCIIQFVEKDNKLADTVIRGILKYWPLTNSSKEVLFLGELEEVLEATQEAEFQRCMVSLFRQIAGGLNSSHFQVAERSLFLWNNVQIRNLTTQNRKVILPIILPALERNLRGHWNQAVQGLTLNVRKVFLDADQEFFEECLHIFQENEVKEREMQAKREFTWKLLEDVAASKAITTEAVLVSQKVSFLSMSTMSPRAVVGT